MGPVMLIIGIGMIGGMLTEGDAYSSLWGVHGSRALIRHRGFGAGRRVAIATHNVGAGLAVS
jgi:hypothetical protein